MTKKERILKSLNFEESDIVPYHFGFTGPAYKKVSEYYHNENFMKKIGNHLASIEANTDNAWEEISPNLWRDEFGVVWDRTIDKDIGTVKGCILKSPSLKNYTFPLLRKILTFLSFRISVFLSLSAPGLYAEWKTY